MFMKNALRTATAMSLLAAGGVSAESLTIAIVNNGHMINMQTVAECLNGQITVPWRIGRISVKTAPASGSPQAVNSPE